MSDHSDDEINQMFQSILGRSPDKSSTTTQLMNQAEDLYIRVAGMKDIRRDNGGKGFATDEVGEQLALYAGMEWEAIDNKLASVCESLWNSLNSITDRLGESEDPEEIKILVELMKNKDIHLVKNVSYHSFWLGYFTHEKGAEEGLVTPVDENALPLSTLDKEEVIRIGANATLQAMSDVDSITKRDDEDHDEWLARVENYRMPSLGLTLPELIAFQESATKASMATIVKDVTSVFPTDDDINVWGMNIALGIMIGRALERRGDGQGSSDE